MDALSLMLAVAALAPAIYTHLRLGDFVRGERRVLALRAFLVALGVGVGVLAASATRDSPANIFVIGFGVVHLPPAILLMLKRWRGEGRS